MISLEAKEIRRNKFSKNQKRNRHCGQRAGEAQRHRGNHHYRKSGLLLHREKSKKLRVSEKKKCKQDEILPNNKMKKDPGSMPYCNSDWRQWPMARWEYINKPEETTDKHLWKNFNNEADYHKS